MLEVKFTTQHKQQYTIKFQTHNRQNTIFLLTYKYIYTYSTYIHTYKQDLRIASHLLHEYLLIANGSATSMQIS